MRLAPADERWMYATKFEFVINLKMAKVLGLDVPLGLSRRRRSDRMNRRACGHLWLPLQRLQRKL